MVSQASPRARLTRHCITKLLLRLLNFLASIIGVGTAASGFRYSPNIIWLTIPLAVAALWAAINVALLLAGPRAAPHPALPLAVDLALVPLLAAAAGLAGSASAVFSAGLAANKAYHACAFSLIGTDDRDEAACDGLLVQVAALALAAAVCAALAAVVHFAFFVSAVREVRARRRRAQEARDERRARDMAVEMVRLGAVTAQDRDENAGG